MRWLLLSSVLLACGARSEIRDVGVGAPDAAVPDVLNDVVGVEDVIAPPPPFLDGLSHPDAIAVDAQNVYFTEVNMVAQPMPLVLECAKTGCNDHPTTLDTGVGWIDELALDSTHLYWPEDGMGDVFACAPGGCAQQPSSVVSGVPSAVGRISVANGLLAWSVTGYYTGVVDVCMLGSCSTTTTVIADKQVTPMYVALDAQNLYWTNTVNLAGTVMECPLAGCNDSPLLLADGQDFPEPLLVDGTSVYWMVSGSIRKCAIGGCGNHPTAVYSPQKASVSTPLALDDGWLYWFGAAGAQSGVVKCPVTGCSEPILVVPSTKAVKGIALDATDVYYTVDDGKLNAGAILKHAK